MSIKTNRIGRLSNGGHNTGTEKLSGSGLVKKEFRKMLSFVVFVVFCCHFSVRAAWQKMDLGG
jgi:hypothetical protein